MGLAGSALIPLQSFKNAMKLFKKNLFEASILCSRNPARLLGLNKGEIALGKDADLIILSEDLTLLATIVGGEILYASNDFCLPIT